MEEKTFCRFRTQRYSTEHVECKCDQSWGKKNIKPRRKFYVYVCLCFLLSIIGFAQYVVT